MVLAAAGVKATLWHAHVDWHLTAFEAIDRNAATRLLTFDTATGGLAFTRTNTATNPHAGLGCAFVIGQFIQFHGVPKARLRALLHDLNQMRNLGDHPADSRRIFKFTNLVHFVQAKPDQRFTLVKATTNGRTRLFNNNNSHD
jgi:hypothetical protein